MTTADDERSASGCSSACACRSRTRERAARRMRRDAARGARGRRASTSSWVAPTNYHVTLKFLGWARAEAAAALVRRARPRPVAGRRAVQVPHARGSARSRRSTRRACCGPGSRMRAARWPRSPRRIEAAAEASASRARRAAFHPHVTVGGCAKLDASKTSCYPCLNKCSVTPRVDGVTLFESETKSSWFRVSRRRENRASNGPKPGDRSRKTSDGSARAGGRNR